MRLLQLRQNCMQLKILNSTLQCVSSAWTLVWSCCVSPALPCSSASPCQSLPRPLASRQRPHLRPTRPRWTFPCPQILLSVGRGGSHPWGKCPSFFVYVCGNSPDFNRMRLGSSLININWSASLALWLPMPSKPLAKGLPKATYNWPDRAGWPQRRRHWGLWVERLAKSARQRPKLLRKYSGGDERTRCCRGDPLPPRHHSELCAELKNMKIFEGLRNSRNMVFNVKKLLNVGVGLTLRRKGGKNRWERNKRQI